MKPNSNVKSAVVTKMAILRAQNGKVLCEIPDAYAQSFIDAGLVTESDAEERGLTRLDPTPRLHFFNAVRRLIDSGDLNNDIKSQEAYLHLGRIFDMFEAEIRSHSVRTYSA